MLSLIVSGAALTLTFFLVMHRTGRLRKFLGYAGWMDLIFTVLIFVLFKETYSGMVAGTFAGLFLALGFTVLRNFLGYERLEVQRERFRFKLVWVEYPAKWGVQGTGTQDYDDGTRSTPARKRQWFADTN